MHQPLNKLGDQGPAMPSRGFSVRSVLSALVVITGVVTAILVHFLWTWTANRNVRDIVQQLNQQVVVTVQQDLATLLAGAEAARESLRSIFFQGVVDTRDEAKREFIMLSLLQSHPSFSWVTIGWPDGDFFGAQKTDDREIRMAEVRLNPETSQRELRVDRYRVVPGDIEFQERSISASNYFSTDQPWYTLTASDASKSVWSEVAAFPTRVRPAIATSMRLDVYQNFIGVVSVAIELERLSRFMANLAVGKTGAAYILASDGRVIASSVPLPPDQAPAMEMPAWRKLGQQDDPMLGVTAGALEDIGRDIASISDTTSVEHTEKGRLYFTTFTPLPYEGWVLATVIPAEDFLGDVSENTRRLLWALAIFVIIVAIGATLVSNWVIVRPMRRIIEQLKNVEQFKLDRIERISSPLREFDQLSNVLVQMGQGLASFQKFLPTELVRTLVAQGMQARPGGDHRQLTLMFSDLVGFTRLSEKLGNNVVPILAEYLGRMSQIISQSGGTVDKFIGDAVMAFWNAPLPAPDHPINACRVALICQRMLADMRQEALAKGWPSLHMRIGINSGEVLVGNIGSDERLNYTAIGDPVNIAARLEALNKLWGTEILIGENTRAVAGDKIIVRSIGRVAVYGRQEGIEVFELLGMAEDAGVSDQLGWLVDYDIALGHYRARRWQAAIEVFDKVLEQRPEDGPSQKLKGRCLKYIAVPPPMDWMALETQDEK